MRLLGFAYLSSVRPHLQRLPGRYSVRAHESAFRIRNRERGFAAAPWEDGDLGQPFLPAAAASFDCVLQSALDAGTHRIFIGRVAKARQGEAHAIAYSRRGYRRLTD